MTGVVTEARRVALELLGQVERGRRLDLALQEASARLDADSRRWVHQVCYGVVRLRGRLDHLLDHLLKKGVESITSRLLNILRLGTYQLLYMDGVPSYAAISQTVELVRATEGDGRTGLANGVLRAVDRVERLEDLFPSERDSPSDFLRTWGSHPMWLLDRWLKRWSYDDVRRLVELNNRIPPTYLTSLESRLDDAIAALASVGVFACPVDGASGSLALPQNVVVREVLEATRGVVQDPAAALVTTYGRVPVGSRVLDLCAAPGGKALAMAGDGAYVLAVDSSPARLVLLKENVRRVGAKVDVVRALAEQPPVAEVDAVLLDAPCTGTGTLARHPDARWRLRPEDVQKMVRLQSEMLDAAARVVKPGGLLVYSTCSLEEEENQAQVEAFLGRTPAFEVDSKGLGAEGTVDSKQLDDRGFLQVLPQHSGFDGAFAARLRRVA